MTRWGVWLCCCIGALLGSWLGGASTDAMVVWMAGSGSALVIHWVQNRGGGVSESEREMAVIAEMLNAAEREGLEVEVVMTFGELRKSGDDVFVAARCALHEWDI